MIRTLSFRVVARLVGVLLLTAAALKIHGLATDPVPRMGVFSTPEFQLAAIEFELFLSVWLLWGIRPLGAWLIALVTFASYAVVSFYQAWIGQSSCGCFGRLSISPWYAFALDLTVLAALALARPHLKSLRERQRQSLMAALSPAIFGLGGTLLVAVVLGGSVCASFGSVRAALAYFRGERISVEPRLVNVGTGERGQTQEASVTLSNWTDHPIQVFGGTANCSCTVLDDLPVTIPPNESRPVTVSVRLTGVPGIFTHKAGFLIDDGGFKRISFRLTGRIIAAQQAAR